MGMLYEYSNEELKAMGLLIEEDLTQKERMRDKHSDEQAYQRCYAESASD